MPVFTPHGLKIRLDEAEVARITAPLTRHEQLAHSLLEVEAWEDFPSVAASLTAVSVALMGSGAVETIAAASSGFLVMSLLRSFTYSASLAHLSSALASIPVTLLIVGGSAAALAVSSRAGMAIVVVAFTIAARMGILEVLQLLLSPVRVPLRRALRLLPTHQEAVFMKASTARASRRGVKLDWHSYSP